jgi:hypothetical protein
MCDKVVPKTVGVYLREQRSIDFDNPMTMMDGSGIMLKAHRLL